MPTGSSTDREPVELVTEHREQAPEIVAEEVHVFECTQYQQVGDYADGGPHLQPPFGERTSIGQQGGERDESKEAPVPPAVERVARGKQKNVLHPETAAEPTPVDQEHYRRNNANVKDMNDIDISVWD